MWIAAGYAFAMTIKALILIKNLTNLRTVENALRAHTGKRSTPNENLANNLRGALI